MTVYLSTAELSAVLAETGFTLLGSMRDLDGSEDCHEYFFFSKSRKVASD
jgi:hypothetical protein